MIKTSLVLLALWLVFTRADWASLIIGIPVSLAAAWSFQQLCKERIMPSLSGLLRFIPFFVYESLKGGWDVLSRLIRPKLPVNPGFIDYQMRLHSYPEQLLFSNCICLLPGTLAADIHDRAIKVHVLDKDTDPTPELIRLEQAVAALFPPAHKPGRSS